MVEQWDLGPDVYPMALAVSSHGVYVTDTVAGAGAHQLSLSGVSLRTFGGGVLEVPMGGRWIPTATCGLWTTRGTGCFILLDGHWVQKFNLSGNWVTTWGGQGSAPGSFNFPVGLTRVDSGR